jgi:hypothetical protein
MEDKVVTRRDFLKTSATAAAAGALFLNSPESVFAETDQKTKVVLIRNKDVLGDLNKPKAEVIQEMLDEAVTTLLGESDPAEAWKMLIKPDDVVGIKTNIWNPLRTPEVLEDAIRERVVDAGVDEKNISIRDKRLLSDKLFHRTTALINVRPLRTHHWSGVGSLIKNYILFVDEPWAWHDDTCADLAKIWQLPITEGKTRLNILVMLTPLFHGVGPHHYNPQYVWNYSGLLVGLDPVAVDSTGVRILQAKRNEYFKEDRPITPPVKHVFLADTRHHLGTADPDKIDLVKLGWKEGSLI